MWDEFRRNAPTAHLFPRSLTKARCWAAGTWVQSRLAALGIAPKDDSDKALMLHVTNCTGANFLEALWSDSYDTLIEMRGHDRRIPALRPRSARRSVIGSARPCCFRFTLPDGDFPSRFPAGPRAGPDQPLKIPPDGTEALLGEAFNKPAIIFLIDFSPCSSARGGVLWHCSRLQRVMS
ncbi:hypothetical protein CMUS01_15044 [Colletotrichum musicola]|uniref:Uncharacterized protein n=1 Tax=Colletotrichum musicola TaxID=2175873 RepID=A0A8H6IZX5_9PEZI|nr:hypothetical protein CMUS01_15044 [Colletotrichum musicola]